jgi:hypothetical protein
MGEQDVFPLHIPNVTQNTGGTSGKSDGIQDIEKRHWELNMIYLFLHFPEHKQGQGTECRGQNKLTPGHNVKRLGDEWGKDGAE